MSKPQMFYEHSVHQRSYRSYNSEDLERKNNHLCLVCGKATRQYQKIYGGKWKTFCSDKCSHEWWVTHDWSTLRLSFLKEREDDLICARCKKKIELSEWGINQTWGMLQVDHVIPIWKGGEEFDKNNLQILCIDCASKKNKKDQREFLNDRRSIVSLMHLRYLFHEDENSLTSYFSRAAICSLAS